MRFLAFQPEFWEIVPEDVKLEQLATGFQFLEGPVWKKTDSGGHLYFTDIPASRIYRWDEQHGVSIQFDPTGWANGLAIDQYGNLLACEQIERKIVWRDPFGKKTRELGFYEGKRLNSPNDVIVKSDGTIYFTDPTFGLSDRSKQELSVQGVYRYDPSTDNLTLLVNDFEAPNGLAFSPDEQLLYIDDSNRQHVRVFNVTPNGSLANGRLFSELDPSIGPGVPDGLKVDRLGNVYVTGPGGVWIIDPSGKNLGIIQVPEVTANVSWGDNDLKTLFITATSSLYRIRLTISGL